MKESKTKQLYLVSYVPKDIIDNVLFIKASQLKCYAYILHDKDVYLKDVVNKDTGEVIHYKGDKEIPHYHIYISLKSSRCPTEIVNWFKCEDINGQSINTFVETVISTSGCIEYLIHKNNPEKYQYPTSDIFYGGDDIKLNEDGSLLVFDNNADNTYDIVECLLNNVPLVQIVKIFGKDFIYHYNHFSSLLKDIRHEEMISSELDSLRNENKELTYLLSQSNVKIDNYKKLLDSSFEELPIKNILK